MPLSGYSAQQSLTDDAGNTLKDITVDVTGPGSYTGTVTTDADTGLFRLGPLTVGDYTLTYNGRSVTVSVVPVFPADGDDDQAIVLSGGELVFSDVVGGSGSTVSIDSDGTVVVDGTTVELATDAQLTTEATTRADADTALDGRLDTAEATLAALPGTFLPVAPAWVTGRAYVLNELVLNSGTLYRVSTAHTSAGSFDATKFTAVGGSSLVVQDENANVSTAVAQIDFQGAGVTASSGTGEVIVTIPGGGTNFGWNDVTTYGGVGDGRVVYDGVSTNGSPIVTSATAAFVAGDVGKKLVIANNGTGSQLFTANILSRQSATQVTLDANVTATLSSAALAVGTDNTAAIQAAMDACAANGGGTVFFPTKGTYLVTGPQVTGTVTGTGLSAGSSFAYTGQLLFPAVAFNAKSVMIRLLGSHPITGRSEQHYIAQPPTDGVCILSNAASGNVFSGIPTPQGQINQYTLGKTHMAAFFESLIVRTFTGQNIKAINGYPLMGLTTDAFLVDVATNVALNPALSHASSVGIESPDVGNNAALEHRNTEVLCYGIGITTSEHNYLSNCMIQACRVAYKPRKGNHSVKLDKLCIQSSDVCIQGDPSSGSCFVYGDVTTEINTTFLDDPNGMIRGELIVHTGDQPTNPGLPNIGGGAVNLRRPSSQNPPYAMAGWAGQAVRETFTRYIYSTTSLQNADISQHPWESGVGSIVAGVVQGSGAKAFSGYGTKGVKAPPGNSTRVRSRITLSATNASPGLAIRQIDNNNTFGLMLEKTAAVDRITFVKDVAGTFTQVAILNAAGLVNSTTYKVTVLWDQPVENGPAVVTVWLDGVQKLTYTLTSGEQATFGTAASVGLASSMNGIQEDGGSRWLDFYAFSA